jgi:predicted amidohydrolase
MESHDICQTYIQYGITTDLMDVFSDLYNGLDKFEARSDLERCYLEEIDDINSALWVTINMLTKEITQWNSMTVSPSVSNCLDSIKKSTSVLERVRLAYVLARAIDNACCNTHPLSGHYPAWRQGHHELLRRASRPGGRLNVRATAPVFPKNRSALPARDAASSRKVRDTAAMDERLTQTIADFFCNLTCSPHPNIKYGVSLSDWPPYERRTINIAIIPLVEKIEEVGFVLDKLNGRKTYRTVVQRQADIQERAFKALEDPKAAECCVAVMPELCLTTEIVEELSESLARPTRETVLKALCAGTSLVKDDEGVWNRCKMVTAVAYGPSWSQDKMHRWDITKRVGRKFGLDKELPGDGYLFEHAHMGNSITLVDYPYPVGRVAMLICEDLRVELRKVLHLTPNLVLVPVLSGELDHNCWAKREGYELATSCQCVVVVVNSRTLPLRHNREKKKGNLRGHYLHQVYIPSHIMPAEEEKKSQRDFRMKPGVTVHVVAVTYARNELY